MVYRVNRDPIIDNNRTLRVDRMRVGSFSQKIGIQGTTSGYTSGGGSGAPNNPPPSTVSNKIDKFPFATDTSATDVADITVARYRHSGQSSSENGYNSNGGAGGGSPTDARNVIDKFPFASDANATDVGDTTTSAGQGVRGQSSRENGYSSGGAESATGQQMVNVIDKFPFSSDTNATDVGDLTSNRYFGCAQSSTENGYYTGGTYPIPMGGVGYYDEISKFPFSSDANATDVGDLTITSAFNMTGQQSLTNGYASGIRGLTGPPYTYTGIEKFPFSSDANSTSVGDLTVPSRTDNEAGQSSLNNGYNSGGPVYPPYANWTTIEKFPFSTDANATDVGNLTQGRRSAAGQQA